MSTDFYVTLRATDGSTTAVKIIDSINPLPGSDVWEGDEVAIGAKSGPVASWGISAAVLHTGPGAGGNITLDLFGKKTKKGDEGKGTKLNEMGSFPDGYLTWHCDDVR
jgi:hypothetical protein